MCRLAPLWCALLLSASGAASPSPVRGQERSLVAERMDARITVLGTGVIRVREEIRFHFRGRWNGIFRTLPVRYEGPGGFDYRLRVKLLSAMLSDGAALEVEEGHDGPNLRWKIRVPGAEDTTRTVVLEYRVENGLRFFEEHDELYWNVTGHEWEVELGPASATVALPREVTGVRTASFVGPWGSSSEGGEVDRVGSELTFRTLGPLGWRNGLTLVVGWDPGVIERPTAIDRITDFTRSNLLLLLPLLSWFLMHRVWRARGRDPESRPVTPRYRPPTDLRPSEGGTLIDHHPHLRDLTAGIVDLAIRGHLRIEETAPEGVVARLLKRTEYTLLRLAPADAEPLSPWEEELLEGLFAEGADRVSTEELDHAFYKRLPAIRTGIFDALVSAGHYLRRPDRVRDLWVTVAIVLGGISGAVLLALAPTLGVGRVVAGVAGFGVGAPILVYAFVLPARTRKGARMAEEVRGLAEFLGRVETDRFRRMITTPDQFEALLPWAMALGVDERWAEAFDDLFTEPPDWYRSRRPGGGFHAGYMVASLSNWSSRTGQAMSSAPRSASSGSSGFGGGGFSGGGFGGGGGGGF